MKAPESYYCSAFFTGLASCEAVSMNHRGQGKLLGKGSHKAFASTDAQS